MRSIKEPIPAIFDMCNSLSAAVDAHLAGDMVAAAKLFLAADCPMVWEWGGPSSYYVSKNVRVKNPEGDICRLPSRNRSAADKPDPDMQATLLRRDGYRCRYCGIPVVSAGVRKHAHCLYPEAVRWKNGDYKGQHAGFQALWLQFDHVVPVSRGGSTTLDNLVVTCGLCNFGKWNYTLLQLDLEDPRLRAPEPITWDGLERFLQYSSKLVAPHRSGGRRSLAERKTENLSHVIAEPSAYLPTFFLPGAWISSGYIYTPPIKGRSRWFKIGGSISGESCERDGRAGVLMRCATMELKRRKIEPERYLARTI